MQSPNIAMLGLAVCAFLQLAVGVLTTFPGPSSGSKTVFPSSGSSGPGREAMSGATLSRFSDEEDLYGDHEPAPSMTSGSTVNFPSSKPQAPPTSTSGGGGGGSVSFPSSSASRAEETITFVPRQGKAITFPSFPGGGAGRAPVSINSLPPNHQGSQLPRGLDGLPKASAALPDARSILSSLIGLGGGGGGGGFPMSFGNMNVTDIAAATNRVADELSRSLRMDVRAVSKALAVGGAAMGSLVFLGGMAAMLMSGLGFFNYPGIYATYPYTNVYGTAYPNQYRSAKSLNGQADSKQPVNPNLVPAINDLIGKLAKATQEFGMPK